MSEVKETEIDKFPSSNLQQGDDLYLGDDFSGDYCEARDILLQRSRHKICEAVNKMSAGRIYIAREHFLQLASYDKKYKDVALEVSLILTRILAGDKKYDIENLEDDVFEMGDEE
jgi:hypothetical protein